MLVTRRSRHAADPEQTKAFTLVYQNGHYRLWREDLALAHTELDPHGASGDLHPLPPSERHAE